MSAILPVLGRTTVIGTIVAAGGAWMVTPPNPEFLEYEGRYRAGLFLVNLIAIVAFRAFHYITIVALRGCYDGESIGSLVGMALGMTLGLRDAHNDNGQVRILAGCVLIEAILEYLLDHAPLFSGYFGVLDILRGAFRIS